MELTGNAYLWIVKQDGYLRELWNLDPATVRLEISQTTREQQYRVTLDGQSEVFDSSEIFHMRGLTVRHGKALNPIEQMRSDLTLAMGIRSFEIEGARRGFKTPGVFSVPPGTPTAARERLEGQIKKRSEDPDHWLSTLILRDGAQHIQPCRIQCCQ